jgi:hypothetical protein
MLSNTLCFVLEVVLIESSVQTLRILTEGLMDLNGTKLDLDMTSFLKISSDYSV